MYQRLAPERIVATARQLSTRVAERFPGSGLSRVAAELIAVTERAAVDSEWFRRPQWKLRAVTTILITAMALAPAIALFAAGLPRPTRVPLVDILQGIESGINDVVFVGVAIWFLLSLETRVKRRRALDAMHALRAMAHIIDMHQLTKDPERVMHPRSGPNTPSSPARTMTVFELSRYLDYSSEMLSLLSKSAALYIQDFNDPVTISTVNDLESLTAGLSRKIWQKIMILDRMAADGAA